MRVWLVIAGLSGAIAVFAGAYGYHWLAYDDSAQKDFFNLGVQYHVWHSLALLAVALLAGRVDHWSVKGAGACFTAGIVLFSGTLYGFGLTAELISGVAPTGGTLLMAGWLLLAVAGWRAFPQHTGEDGG